MTAVPSSQLQEPLTVESTGLWRQSLVKALKLSSVYRPDTENEALMAAQGIAA